ncbi:MAG: hypothetical protein PHO08_02020 [Methylococcales bacterium]|nr:hypothetical protein [Methylococcales bacterium]MDD5630667.1 hypothetical protein [Methylococcales bacterium]
MLSMDADLTFHPVGVSKTTMQDLKQYAKITRYFAGCAELSGAFHSRLSDALSSGKQKYLRK